MAHDILIVDDERDICTLIAGILEDEGHTARRAHNSTEAIDAARTVFERDGYFDARVADMDTLGIETAHWMGVSFGAEVAMVAAALHGHRVQQLTGVSAAAGACCAMTSASWSIRICTRSV